MAEEFVGDIKMVAFNFAPKGWAFCNGQLLPISQNTALFSILGTTYGGDGKSTFALPNLQGRAPIHAGNGNGLTYRDLGEIGGSETVTLDIAQIPPHNHSVSVNNANASTSTPSTSSSIAAPVDLNGDNANAFTVSGSGQAHNNLAPYLTMNYIIALQGVFPPRS
jgi:microcystin-dependent protein